MQEKRTSFTAYASSSANFFVRMVSLFLRIHTNEIRCGKIEHALALAQEILNGLRSATHSQHTRLVQPPRRGHRGKIG
jgi:hypothetical protein